MANPKVLLTGATGFIGGTVLSQLVHSDDPNVKPLPITAIVRQPRQQSLLTEKGIRAIIVDDFDDAKGLAQAASEHDIVVNVANGFHTTAAVALMEGLGRRVKETGSDAHFLHASGTTCLSVSPLRPSPFKYRIFSDRDDNVYEYEAQREAHQAYDLRATDLAIIHAGERLGVKTYIVMPPLVYGRGTGFFNMHSQLVPSLIRNAINTGYAEHIGTGEGLLGHVDVTDLGRLYDRILGKIIRGEQLAHGREGYYFAEPGRHSWTELSILIANAGSDLGALQSKVPRSISLEDGAVKLCNGNEMMAEMCFAINASTQPDKSYDIGWKHLKTDLDWEASVTSTFKEILADPGITGGHLFRVELH